MPPPINPERPAGSLPPILPNFFIMSDISTCYYRRLLNSHTKKN
jgi:hypothetical protein